MKKMGAWINKISTPSRQLNMPFIYMYANDEVVIEQFDELLAFSNEKIELLCQALQIVIIGNELKIDLLYPQEVIVKGKLMSIHFHPY